MVLFKILSLIFLLSLSLPYFWAGVDRHLGNQSARLRGVQSCQACHQQVFETFIQTAHFNTSSLATDQSIKGDFSEGHNIPRPRGEGARFRMEKRADGFYQSAYESATSQARSRTERFDIVIGSGRKGQSYLYWKNGLLFQLPVSYLAGDEGWVNSPGYIDGQMNFDRIIPPRCLECHSASFKPAGTPSAPRYSSDYELGISCQNCHGDGSKHVAYHVAHPAEKAGQHILNPARFSRERKLDNCALCHSGAARELRKPPFSYQPGARLDDYLLPESDRDNPSPDVHGNQVALLRRSKCFRASEAMSCSTCHNVHQPERDLTLLARKCLQCHQQSQCKMTGKLGARLMDQCIDCHMPNEGSRLISIDTPEKKLSVFYRNHAIGIYPKAAASALQTLQEKQHRVQFVDVTREARITFKHENGASKEKIMVETFGSGVAWLDYDNDGLLDLYFVNGANLAEGKSSPGNVLMRNTGKGAFVDVTKQAGVAGDGGFGTGVAVGDYDNDGWLDIYVTGYSANTLYRNNGNGAFTDVTAKAGVKGGGWSSSAGFFDYDRDGRLDLYVVRYLDYNAKEDPYCGYKKEGYRMYCDPRNFDGVPDLLYRNNGDGSFTDVSKKAGVANPAGKGLGVTFGDFDNDGWPDIYVANDTVRNFLYRNNGDGTFIDLAYSAGAGYDNNGKARAGMGTEFADFDGDGWLDIFVTNFSEEFNGLFRNRGGQTFEDVAEQAGLGSSFLPLGFGAKLFDYDNDGWTDIHVTNGHVIDNIQLYNPRLSYQQTDLLYHNERGRFRDVSSESGPAFQIKHVGRGAAAGDFDNDGDLDLVTSNCGQRPILMRNDGGNRNHWLAVKARGKESNSFGVGARVIIEAAGRARIREIYSAGSYLSGSDLRLSFGLGAERKVKRLEIIWPSGKRQTLNEVAADQTLLLEETQARKM